MTDAASTLPRASLIAPATLLVVSLLGLALARIDLAELFPPPPTQAAAVDAAQAHPTEPPPRQPVYTDEARALLDNLTAGEQLAGWQVIEIDGVVDDGEILIRFSREDAKFTAVVTPHGSRPHQPPAQADGYDLFYNRVERPEQEAEVLTVLTALAARIQNRAH